MGQTNIRQRDEKRLNDCGALANTFVSNELALRVQMEGPLKKRFEGGLAAASSPSPELALRDVHINAHEGGWAPLRIAPYGAAAQEPPLPARLDDAELGMELRPG